MRNGTLLWDAMGMIGEDLLEEAVKGEKQMAKRYGKRVWILAAAGILLLSLLGWAAKEWIFAPGFGIIPTYTDMGVTVYATEERVQIGQYTLEGAVFTENEAEPAENKLMFWLYCDDSEQLQYYPDIWVNGEPYAFLHFRMTQNSNLCSYTYIKKTVPDYDWENGGEPIPMETIPYSGDGTVVTIQPVKNTSPFEKAEPDAEPVEVSLYTAEGGEIRQIRLTGEKYVSFLPLTDNVVMANLHDPEPLTCAEEAWDMSVRGEYTIRYADGTESALGGYFSMDDTDPGRVTGIVSDRYDAPVSSVVLHSVSVNMDCMLRVAEEISPFTYTFPLMATGETLPVEERMWSGMGLELWLTAVTRTEYGLQGTTELRNLTGDPLITGGSGSCMFYAGEGIERNGYVSDEHALLQRICVAENWDIYAGRILKPGGASYALTMEEGDPVILALQEVTITYAHADGTPLGEIHFP